MLLSLSHIPSPSFTFFFPLLLSPTSSLPSFLCFLLSHSLLFHTRSFYLLHIYFITFSLYSIDQYPIFSSSSHFSLLFMFLPLSHISFPSLTDLSSSLCLCVYVYLCLSTFFLCLCVSPHFQCFLLIPHQCDGCSSIRNGWI